ncbi:MAG: MFS transporter [Actinomycetota bacterium]
MSARAELRTLVAAVYLPILASQTGLGMLVPVLPLHLRDLGYDFTLVTLVLGATGLGGLLANPPTGRLVERDRTDLALLVALVLMTVSIAALAVVDRAVPLILAQAVTGAGGVVLILSRQTRILRTTSPEIRGRAMSFIGGSLRISLLVGPAAGGLLADAVGAESTFLVAAALSALGLIPAMASRRSLEPVPVGAEPTPADEPSLARIVRSHAGALVGAGAGQLGSMAIRFGRQALFPLYGASIGLDTGEVGLVVSLSALVDLVVFPVSGILMDRHGRLFAVVPAFTIMAAAMFVVAATDGTAGLIVAGVLYGLGNGIGSGTMLTVSTDLAPDHGAGPFLAALGIVRDLGRIAGPLIVGVAADQLGIDWSAIALGILGLATAGLFLFVVGETRPTGTAIR